MADILNDLKREIYAALRSAAPTKAQAPSVSNAGGSGNHGGQGQGSSTGQGHSSHGQGLGLGHTNPGGGAGIPAPGRSGVGGPRTILPRRPQSPVPQQEGQSLILVKQISDRYPNVDPNLIQSLVAEIQTFGFTSDTDNDGRILAVDFDGTITEPAQFPEIGDPKLGAIEVLRQLQNEGWKVVIHSHRASLPGGKEQIGEWLAQQGLQVGAIIPKIFARWYVDDKAVPFTDNWQDIYNKMHYDVPVEVAGPKVEMAPAILAGKFSMQEIASHLGYDYPEFRADIKKAYGDFSKAAHPEVAVRAVENLFRNKYGLAISPAELAKCEDDERYWRTKLAYAVMKLETNHLEAGDEVLILTGDNNFGKLGTIMNLVDNEAEVLEDGVANLPMNVPKPIMNLRLLSGPEKCASLLIGATPRKITSSFYPDGLPETAVTAWYKFVGPEVYKRLANLETITYHKVFGKVVACQHDNFTGDFAADVNVNNLVSICAKLPDYTDTVAMKLVPTAGMSDYNLRHAVSSLVDDIAVRPDVTDIQVRFSGSIGYYVVVSFRDEANLTDLQGRLNQAVTAHIEGAYNPAYVLGDTVEPNRIAINTAVRVVPAAYSVEQSTGLVCLPLDPMKLESFTPAQATITHLREVYGDAA